MQLSWRQLFIEKNDRTIIQLFRYAIVGGLAFVLDFGTFFLLLSVLEIQYLLSAAIAFSLGLAANYLTSIAWVFDRRVMNDARTEFGVYLVLGLFGLLITELTLYSLTGLLGIHALPSKIVATAITFFWNFWSRKIALFTPNDEVAADRRGLIAILADPPESIGSSELDGASGLSRCAPTAIAD